MSEIFQDQPERTEISSLGEFGLIDHLTKGINLVNASSKFGVGDDAAVIDHNGFQTLVSVDLLVEGVHFDLTYTPLKHLGYKAAVVNFSDMAAMNAKPTQIVIGMAVSNRFSLEAIEEIYAGIKLACEKYHVDLVGGDTTSSVSGLMLSVTVIGKAKPEEICYRKGASENDLLCVSGDLGGAYMGLLLLEREKAAFKVNPELQPDLHGFDYVLQRQLKPEARLDITDLLRKAEIKPTSMIDISDGLASEIKHLCKASGLGCQIYEEKIPIDVTTASVAEEFKMIPSIPALNGGEDYELLFTVSLKDHEKISAIPGITIIGHMTENQGEEVMITPDNQYIPLKAQGWDALIKHSETE
jgi:thiamine-monophosphate kinase